MLGLTANGQRDAGLALGALGVLVVVYLAGHCSGERAAVTQVDTAAERVIAHTVDSLTGRVDSLTQVVQVARRRAAVTAAPEAQAIARTNTAGDAERAARDTLERVLADSLAALATVKAAAEQLAAADSMAYAAVVAERQAAGARIMALSSVILADSTLIDRQSEALAAAAEDRRAQAKIIADLIGQRPGLVHRIMDGALDVVAAGACGAAGSLLSAAGAVVAGAACLAAAAAWSP